MIRRGEGKDELRERRRERSRKVSLVALVGKWVTVFVAVVVAIGACGGDGSGVLDPAKAAGLKSCPQGTAIFTVPPIALGSMTGWVPLGNLNPPAHTFPTDHQYIYLPFSGQTSLAEVEIVSPSDAMITRARRTSYSNRNADYSIELSPCVEVHAELGHVTSITSSLLARLGAFDQGCTSYSPDPYTTVTACYTSLIAVPVTAGETLGTTGGMTGVFGLDFLLYDARVAPLKFAKPARWRTNSDGFDSFHVVAASDYFAEPAKSQIAAKVGSFDGRVRRTVAPTGGTIEVDVAGTAQGAWFNPTQPTNPESAHLAIVPDNVDPTKLVISIGTSQPGLNSRAFTLAPSSSGVVNRAASQITPDGQTYCFDLGIGNVMFVKMLDANTLRVETRVGNAITCTSLSGFSFTNQAMDYVR